MNLVKSIEDVTVKWQRHRLHQLRGVAQRLGQVLYPLLRFERSQLYHTYKHSIGLSQRGANIQRGTVGVVALTRIPSEERSGLQRSPFEEDVTIDKQLEAGVTLPVVDILIPVADASRQWSHWHEISTPNTAKSICR